jgi:hypothetical protein
VTAFRVIHASRKRWRQVALGLGAKMRLSENEVQT